MYYRENKNKNKEKTKIFQNAFLSVIILSIGLKYTDSIPYKGN